MICLHSPKALVYSFVQEMFASSSIKLPIKNMPCGKLSKRELSYQAIAANRMYLKILLYCCADCDFSRDFSVLKNDLPRLIAKRLPSFIKKLTWYCIC